MALWVQEPPAVSLSAYLKECDTSATLWADSLTARGLGVVSGLDRKAVSLEGLILMDAPLVPGR